ncbi:MAG: 50S ribosomal protein L25/general stress protein Ctc [Rhodobacteraceae bacterium]|nr:50S ribosomal protein L25/general stress protein Ctc [Paracoccaceae bacterium]
MAKEVPELLAELRPGTGKGAARQARRDGFVPGIVYGGGKDPAPIQIDFNYLHKRLNEGRFMSTLFNLKIQGGDDVRVICRGVQRHVVKDLPMHVDFMRLESGSEVSLFIPVRFINEEECPGLRRGGVLTIVRGEVEMVVNAGDIPVELTGDLTDLEIGDVLTISSIELPSGTRPRIADRDFVIANISSPSGLKSAEEEEAEAEEEEIEEEIEEEEE